MAIIKALLRKKPERILAERKPSKKEIARKEQKERREIDAKLIHANAILSNKQYEVDLELLKKNQTILKEFYMLSGSMVDTYQLLHSWSSSQRINQNMFRELNRYLISI